ncbi:hypothetical protein [Campylobacter concisus]|uniref:hypothetical protein n=1 Tax=Campylobacter concisus TaxID=199 RepID=UPI000D3CA464|nr:hypothetical protein [Campylobacter concisus]
MTKKYKTKMEDSFKTKVQLFLFDKAFSWDNLDESGCNDYYIMSNIETIKKDFKNFKVTNEVANLYSSKYYQFELNSDKSKIKHKGKELNIMIIEQRQYFVQKSKEFTEILDALEKEYENDFEEKFSETDFNKMLDKTTCSYCGISLAQIEELGKNGKLNNKRSDTRGYTLEIDRKLPNLEYSKENCCMACYWCNNAKTDEFSPEEFKPIAEGIRKTWNERLKAIGYSKEEIKDVPDPKIWNTKFDTSMEPDIEK